MPKATVVIAADHAGYELKATLKEELAAMGYAVVDLGTHDMDSVDYPDFANTLAAAIVDGEAERGVLICGTGIGISMAANRHKGVRAAPCQDVTSSRLAREHNDANVLALGARLIGAEVAKECLRTFFTTSFAGERHKRRVDKLG